MDNGVLLCRRQRSCWLFYTDGALQENHCWYFSLLWIQPYQGMRRGCQVLVLWFWWTTWLPQWDVAMCHVIVLLLVAFPFPVLRSGWHITGCQDEASGHSVLLHPVSFAGCGVCHWNTQHSFLPARSHGAFYVIMGLTYPSMLPTTVKIQLLFPHWILSPAPKFVPFHPPITLKCQK